ncbi:MAG: hypothetical protein NZ902_04080 [Acidilobaceae archaeon]|nr:hypothetical protein [Acidilobaceae archaeon]MDW7974391.1 hypothetical protein [Sulfolobales archaeon]
MTGRRVLVNVGQRRLEVVRLFLERPIPPRPLRSSMDHVLIAGLPREVDPCSAILAYMYVTEDVLLGTKVKNKSLLFAMNILGLKQTKEVVEGVTEFLSVVVAGPEGKASEALEEVRQQLGADFIDVRYDSFSCSPEELERITRERVERL